MVMIVGYIVAYATLIIIKLRSLVVLLCTLLKMKQGLGRALDPHANGASLSKLIELKLEFLGGQTIDQKRKKGWLTG